MSSKASEPYEFRFERRRYGRTTYTWAFVRHGDDWLELGDPWPCITPKRSELDEAARLAIARRDLKWTAG